MTIEIPMRLSGIDLREDGAYERVHPELIELFWMSNGPISLAVLFSDAPAPVSISDAIDWARRIAKLMPGVSVSRVHDELVSISDIASRASVAPEAVRMWTTGKRRASARPFPVPRQVVGGSSGGKTMNLYAWRDVVSWSREVLGRDYEEGIKYLTDAQLAQLNAQLASVGSTEPEDSSPEATDAAANRVNLDRTPDIERLLVNKPGHTPSHEGDHSRLLRDNVPTSATNRDTPGLR